MDLQQYQIDASRTESVDSNHTCHPVRLECILLAYKEVGQILDQVKKNVFYNKPYDEWAILEHVLECKSALDQVVTPVVEGRDEVALSDCTSNERILHSIIGIATESTELVEALVANVEHGTAFDTVNILEEMGDVHWYQSIAMSELGADWDSVFDVNIAKLKSRYPDKFTDDKAQVRNLTDERGILEQLTVQ